MEDEVISATKLWVERFVHGYKLCPWAGGALNGTMKITIQNQTADSWNGSQGHEMISLTEGILEEARKLATKLADEPSTLSRTTLIVMPKFSNDFEAFLDVISVIEGLLEQERGPDGEHGLDKHVQVASFHPLYQFEDSDTNCVTNYSNRSPFPVIHLLRVHEVSRAIESYQRTKGDMSNIWKDNQKKLKDMGKKEIMKVLQKIVDDAKE